MAKDEIGTANVFRNLNEIECCKETIFPALTPDWDGVEGSGSVHSEQSDAMDLWWISESVTDLVDT